MTSTTVEDLMIRNIFGVFGERDAAARAAAADPPIARGAAESVAGWRSGAPRSTPVESSAHSTTYQTRDWHPQGRRFRRRCISRPVADGRR
jgi:hypothetical protein